MELADGFMNRPAQAGSSGESAGILAKWYITSAGIALLLTGVAKLYSATGAARILDLEDPIFNIPFRVMMVVAAFMEVGVATVCLRNRFSIWPHLLVVWLALTFVTYRVGLLVGDYRSPCPCLGALTDALHLSPVAAERLSIALLSYLLVGSAYFLISEKWREWRASTEHLSIG